MTGANSGIGYETARALVHKGATVILACRNEEKGEASELQISQEDSKGKAVFMQLDLSDLASVRRFSLEYANRYDKLDILINNAGIMRTPFGKTADGFELQFGTNYLGHFALTGLLLNLIIRTPQARVFTVSSGGPRGGSQPDHR
ncbi:MAG: SDR family NAD(P)-dependent oxidoreductase [Candidatus Odinarchaeota archaeon]